MKKIFFVSILIFIFCLSTFAQDNLPCPKISVSGPEDFLIVGRQATFKAKVEGIDYKFGYLWTISTGKIIEGQGTSVLKFLLEKDEAFSVTATVEITGLPAICQNSASATASIPHESRPVPVKIAEISKQYQPSYKDKMVVLFTELNTNPTAKGYILEKFKRNTRRSLIEQKVNNIFKFIISRNFPIERINLFVGIGDKNLTEMWILQQGEFQPPLDDSIKMDFKNYKKSLAKIFTAKQKIVAKKNRKN